MGNQVLMQAAAQHKQWAQNGYSGLAVAREAQKGSYQAHLHIRLHSLRAWEQHWHSVLLPHSLQAGNASAVTVPV